MPGSEKRELSGASMVTLKPILLLLVSCSRREVWFTDDSEPFASNAVARMGALRRKRRWPVVEDGTAVFERTNDRLH